MTFHLNRSWGRDFPTVTQPKIMGYFSLNSDRQMSFDSSQLKYYCPQTSKKLHFDLNHGIDSVHRKPASAGDEKIDNILRWMNHQISPSPGTDKWLQSDFVCWRGLLTKIMRTPYEKKDGWIICASKWRGTIYLCAFDTDADLFEKSNQTKKQLTFMSWGFKFEQYVLADAPDKLPDVSKPVDEAAEFGCIFETCLNNTRILYGAEMDGILCDELLSDPLPLQKLKFIELKTSRIVETSRHLVTLKKFKFIKWWCQSFLVGIENVLCGFRDDNGIVRKIENYRVSDLAKMSKEFWSASETMNFCDKFLQHVKQTVVNDYNQSVYKFERKSYGDIITTEIPSPSEYSFLPEWFTQCKNS